MESISDLQADLSAHSPASWAVTDFRFQELVDLEVVPHTSGLRQVALRAVATIPLVSVASFLTDCFLCHPRWKTRRFV